MKYFLYFFILGLIPLPSMSNSLTDNPGYTELHLAVLSDIKKDLSSIQEENLSSIREELSSIQEELSSIQEELSSIQEEDLSSIQEELSSFQEEFSSIQEEGLSSIDDLLSQREDLINNAIQNSIQNQWSRFKFLLLSLYNHVNSLLDNSKTEEFTD